MDEFSCVELTDDQFKKPGGSTKKLYAVAMI